MTLRPWRTDPQRIFINGPMLLFDAGAATAWALIVHELVSNAAKYGALKGPDGILEIEWRESEDALIFEWREKSDHVVMEGGPDAKGFGQTIVDRLVDGFLGGAIERTITDKGVYIKITIEKRADE